MDLTGRIREKRLLREINQKRKETNPMKKQDKGFTLVELLIVIVILGILATVTVFAVRGITDQGEESACNADLKTVQTAVEAYFAQEGGTAIPTSATVVDGVTGTTPEGTLIEVGLLVSSSENYTVAADGGLTYQAPAGGGANPCLPSGGSNGDAVVNT
ncbi:MAG: prepilin-type N-terminal cleavage/methylation domain-containing protein [Actinomycetota bacterium]